MTTYTAPTVKTSIAFSTRSRIILLIFVAPWMFDYRAEIEDSIAIFIQVSALCISLIGFVASLFFLPTTPLDKGIRFVCLALAAYISEAAIVGLLEGQDFRGVITLTLPTLLLLMAVKAIPTILNSTKNYGQFIRDLSAIAVFGELFKAIYVFAIKDMTVASVRYQILGPSVILLTAYILGRLFTRFSLRDFFIALVHFGSIVLSLTRTQLLILGAICAANLLMWPQLLLSKAVLARIAVAIFAVITLISVGFFSGNVYSQRWVERLVTNASEVGYDVTWATRLAEIEFQLSGLTESPKAILIGHGLAPKNKLIGFYYELVREAIGDYDLNDVGFGHTVYTSILFQSGILFGTLVLISFSYLFIRALFSLNAFGPQARQSKIAFIGLWGASGVIGTSIFGFFGGTLGDRGTSIYFGIAIAMMIWANEYVRNKVDRAENFRRPPEEIV